MIARPGELRHRLVLEEPSRVGDGGGGFIESWSPVATVSAAISPTGGSESVRSDRPTGSVSHEIVLRHRPDVIPTMRFKQDSRVFHILAVIDFEERRRWLKCLCEERDL